MKSMKQPPIRPWKSSDYTFVFFLGSLVYLWVFGAPAYAYFLMGIVYVFLSSLSEL